MSITERRFPPGPDRRRVPRGGRRAGDRPGRFPHLLVADSYDGARVPCVRYLERFGFQVDEAVDAQEVLAKIDAKPPHLILIEKGLPNTPVSQLVRGLREQPHTKSIPVIIMTSDLGSTRREAEAPLVGLLEKPFALSTMLQEIRRLLREHPPVPPPALTA